MFWHRQHPKGRHTGSTDWSDMYQPIYREMEKGQRQGGRGKWLKGHHCATKSSRRLKQSRLVHLRLNEGVTMRVRSEERGQYQQEYHTKPSARRVWKKPRGKEQDSPKQATCRPKHRVDTDSRNFECATCQKSVTKMSSRIFRNEEGDD